MNYNRNNRTTTYDLMPPQQQQQQQLMTTAAPPMMYDDDRRRRRGGGGVLGGNGHIYRQQPYRDQNVYHSNRYANYEGGDRYNQSNDPRNGSPMRQNDWNNRNASRQPLHSSGPLKSSRRRRSSECQHSDSCKIDDYQVLRYNRDNRDNHAITVQDPFD
jgi:hypothetical protein